MAPKPFASGYILNAADVNDLTGVYDRSTTTVDVVSSAAQTDVYSKSIGAGHMSTDRMLRLTMLGDYLNNTGSAANLTVRVAWDAVADIFIDTKSMGNLAARVPFRLVIEIANLASASSQWMGGVFMVEQGGTAPAVGFGDLAGSSVPGVFGGTATANTATAKTLAVSVQHGSSSANLSFKKKYAVLELL